MLNPFADLVNPLRRFLADWVKSFFELGKFEIVSSVPITKLFNSQEGWPEHGSMVQVLRENTNSPGAVEATSLHAPSMRYCFPVE